MYTKGSSCVQALGKCWEVSLLFRYSSEGRKLGRRFPIAANREGIALVKGSRCSLGFEGRKFPRLPFAAAAFLSCFGSIALYRALIGRESPSRGLLGKSGGKQARGGGSGEGLP